MAEPTIRARFQMVGARAAVLDGPSSDVIERQINAIENALESVPDFTFDLSKTLVESVCKTVLADLGQPTNPNWDGPQLLRETTNRLSMLPRNHPDPKKARDSVEKTVRGLLQTIQGLCELRNGYGMASHGRDIFAARLDLRHATLAAQAADAIVSFIYRVHHDTLTQTLGARVYYEDHADFNEAFDRDNEMIRVSDLRLRPSEVLFKGDPGAYRTALEEHLAELSEAENSEDSSAHEQEAR